MSVKLISDDRERRVIPFIEKLVNNESLAVQHKIQRLHISDYLVMYKGYILLAIERKTWQDLASSFRDGRKANISKLLNLREKTNCKLIYLIEGNAFPSDNEKFSRINFKCLQGHLDNIMLRDNISIVQTKNLEHTAKRLLQLTKRFTTMSGGIIQKIDTIEGGSDLKIATTSLPKPDDAIKEMMLQSLSGVSSITSGVLMKNKFTLPKLFKLFKSSGDKFIDIIALLKYDTGKSIGLKRSTRIYKNIKSLCSIQVSQTSVRVLISVPGISKNTSVGILSKHSLDSIISGGVTVNDLSIITKGKKMKLGKKIATRVLEILEVLKCSISQTKK